MLCLRVTGTNFQGISFDWWRPIWLMKLTMQLFMFWKKSNIWLFFKFYVSWVQILIHLMFGFPNSSSETYCRFFSVSVSNSLKIMVKCFLKMFHCLLTAKRSVIKSFMICFTVKNNVHTLISQFSKAYAQNSKVCHLTTRRLIWPSWIFMRTITSLNIFYSINVHRIIQYKWLNVRTKKRIRTEAGLIEFLSLTYVHIY